MKFMKSENLSPSQLADNLGVQRSGVSHIISGRNNPGLEFVQRILKHYPNINPDWLLLNKGAMYRSESDTPGGYEPALEENEDDIRQLNINFGLDEVSADTVSETLAENPVKPATTENSIPAPVAAGNQKKLTDKIIILYKDGSFDIYNSAG
jgi:transcriptional regulator with XRE-family HTH domain